MNLFVGASLITAFIAGMIALFAPCCISFLLPAYLGSVFKERKQVFLMTLVFSAGIFAIMFPVVLGFRVLQSSFLEFHNQTFILGGLVMVAIGIVTFFGLKLPMPAFTQRNVTTDKPDIASIFTLGVFSGITSSCCAPVLFGVLTLSFLSPSFWQATLIALTYVLGIVTPLYVSAYFVDTKKVLQGEFLTRYLFTLRLPGREYAIKMSNLISALIFVPMGLLTIYLTLTGRLEMQEEAQQFGNWVGGLTVWIDDHVGNSGLTQIFFLIFILGLFFLMFQRWQKRNWVTKESP